jgi:hypothetical protein
VRISVLLPAGAEGAGEARKALDGLSREASPEIMSTLGLLVSELLVNGPRHADAGGEDVVRLEIDTSPNTIHTEILGLATGGVLPATQEQERNSDWDVILLDERSSRWGTLGGSTGGVWFEIDRWPESAPGEKR